MSRSCKFLGPLLNLSVIPFLILLKCLHKNHLDVFTDCIYNNKHEIKIFKQEIKNQLG